MCNISFLHETATTEIYTYLHTLSLHDSLPICEPCCPAGRATRLLPKPRSTSPAILPDAAQQFANDSGNAARVDQRRTRYSCACCWRWAGKGTAISHEIGRASCRERVCQYV